MKEQNKKDKKQDNSDIAYMPLFMSIGISIGVGLGAVLNNIPMFMCIGLSIGVGIGAALDASKKKNAEERAKESLNQENGDKSDAE